MNGKADFPIHGVLQVSDLSKATNPHVVLLIHGIRDYALWQNEIKHTLRDEGFLPVSTNYGRFDLLRFLAPIAFFRNRAIETVWVQIRDARKEYPAAIFSVIAHSFGTYVFARILQKGFDFRFNRVIFCGSVLPYNFPFEQISDRFTSPIVNDVGTRDVWPAMAESATWGYGSAGTYGFRRPRVEDRWHNGAHHGYFLSACFCKKFWVPFLRDGTVVRGATEAEPSRLWLRALSFLRIKYIVVVALAAATFATSLSVTCGFTGSGYKFGEDGQPFYFWSGTISALLQDAQDRCALASIVGDQSRIMKLLARREFATVERSDSDQLKSTVSCVNFKYGQATSERDPVRALELLGERFPNCAIVRRTPSGGIETLARTDNTKHMTKVKGRWLCDCSREKVEEFGRSF